MVEVFKTNVERHDHATMLVDQIHQVFTEYKANFDLDDCDRILRIEGPASAQTVIGMMNANGFACVVLDD